MLPDSILSNNLRAWAEIDGGALTHNIGRLKNLSPPAPSPPGRGSQKDATNSYPLPGGKGVGEAGGIGLLNSPRVMAVVKADAYGHGIANIAPLCASASVTDFGVASAAEGVALRSLVPLSASVFLLAPSLLDEAAAIVSHDLTPLVSDEILARAIAKEARAARKTADIYLDVDTGMGRAGAQIGDAARLLTLLDATPGLRVTGVATHFARADEDEEDARRQHGIFLTFLATLGERADGLLIHAANSPAALLGVRHQMIRPGLLLYGIDPSPEITAEGFRPVLSLRARVTLCRRLPAGATISYGRTFTVPPGGGVYATLGIGYGDGVSRRLSNLGFVLLHGQRAPICGRVCMDQIVVDVSQISGVASGDVATLVGANGDARITVGELAALIDATPHEITTSLTARVPRVLL